jgi:hypothetical protein
VGASGGSRDASSMAGTCSRAPAGGPAARKALATSGTGVPLDIYAIPLHVVVHRTGATAANRRFPSVLLHKLSSSWIWVSGNCPSRKVSEYRGNPPVHLP